MVQPGVAGGVDRWRLQRRVRADKLRPNLISRDLGPWAAPLGRSGYSGLASWMDGLDRHR